MERELYMSLSRKQRLFAAFSFGTYTEKRKMMFGDTVSPGNIRTGAEPFLLIGDEDYPEKLYDLSNPPLLLYYRGEKKLLKESAVAVVGSRAPSAYGLKITKNIVRELSLYNITIISGGARGVDTAAHRTALQDGNTTICVLGCGLGIDYPKENAELFKSISTSGLLLSEYPRGFKPEKWTFPMRNRIIAALSEDIVVTEASMKSGSLHTATYGVEINREVHAVPHQAESPWGQGCNHLIELGAGILYNSRDFSEDFRKRHKGTE